MTVVVAAADKWDLLQAKSHEARVVSAFRSFRSAGIEPILIKGWAAARYYPAEHLRHSGDVDLAVSPKDFHNGRELLRNEDVARDFIDLHESLRHLDTLEWDDLFEHSVLVVLNGSRIRLLCPEDNLRVLCVHWLNDGGGHKDKLWDIYYAVANRPPDFDWQRCLDTVSQNRRRWIICAIGLANRYLGLEIDDLSFAGEAKTIPKWVFRCIEREWNREGRLEPVLTTVHDKRLLFQQILRRLPPNPIRATIEADGDLYDHRRAWYQMRVLARRTGPFLRGSLAFAMTILRGRRA